MAMLEINDLTREFTRRGARFAAVDHVSFSMDQGELVAIIGRSGNGKSTLLNLIAGLLKPTSGTVEIDGRNVSKLSDKELSQLRDLCDGKYEIESHMMLDVSVQRDGRVIYSNLALNEALIARGNISRVIRLQIFTEQGKLVDVAGDGVIVASPTGSTAYSLSAGGPVVEPTARNFIVSPICAHSVHANAYVLSPERVITVQTEKTATSPSF